MYYQTFKTQYKTSSIFRYTKEKRQTKSDNKLEPFATLKYGCFNFHQNQLK